MFQQKHYKNSIQVAREFGVTSGTVHNWLQKTQKYNIETININGKARIIINDTNIQILKNLSTENKKFKPLGDRITIKVKPKSHEYLSDNQRLLLMTTLVTKSEMPYKYHYLNEGGAAWDRFYKKTIGTTEYPATSTGNSFLKDNLPFLKKTFESAPKVNIVDIGCGDGIPTNELIQTLKENSVLSSYTAIDISPEMLEICKTNTKDSLKGIPSDYIHLDIENASFHEVLLAIKKTYGKDIPTLILCLGSTIGNMESISRTVFNIKDGMLDNDKLLIVNSTLGKNEPKNTPPHGLSIIEGYDFLNLLRRTLGIADEYIENFHRYNEETGYREYGFMPTRDLFLDFVGYDEVIPLYKGQKVTTWKHKKDDFDTVYALRDEVKMKLDLVIKHPIHDNIMYILGKR